MFTASGNMCLGGASGDMVLLLMLLWVWKV